MIIIEYNPFLGENMDNTDPTQRRPSEPFIPPVPPPDGEHKDEREDRIESTASSALSQRSTSPPTSSATSTPAQRQEQARAERQGLLERNQTQRVLEWDVNLLESLNDPKDSDNIAKFVAEIVTRTFEHEMIFIITNTFPFSNNTLRTADEKEQNLTKQELFGLYKKNPDFKNAVILIVPGSVIEGLLILNKKPKNKLAEFFSKVFKKKEKPPSMTEWMAVLVKTPLRNAYERSQYGETESGKGKSYSFHDQTIGSLQECRISGENDLQIEPILVAEINIPPSQGIISTLEVAALFHQPTHNYPHSRIHAMCEDYRKHEGITRHKEVFFELIEKGYPRDLAKIIADYEIGASLPLSDQGIQKDEEEEESSTPSSSKTGDKPSSSAVARNDASSLDPDEEGSIRISGPLGTRVIRPPPPDNPGNP